MVACDRPLSHFCILREIGNDLIKMSYSCIAFSYVKGPRSVLKRPA